MEQKRISINVVLHGDMAQKIMERHDKLGFSYSNMLREALLDYLKGASA